MKPATLPVKVLCRVWIKRLYLLIVLMWGSSCIQTMPSRVVEPPTANNANSATQRWLTRIPCAPPCWEGIVPGTTTVTETIRMLEQNPFVEDVRLVPVPLLRNRQDAGAVSWRWSQSSPDAIRSVAAFNRHSAPQVIYRVELHAESAISLGQIVKAYGHPSHVLLGLSKMSRWLGAEYDRTLVVIYMERGLALLYTPASQTETIILADDLEFYSVVFFVPSVSGLGQALDLSVDFIQSALVRWRDGSDIADYCREAHDSDYGSCH